MDDTIKSSKNVQVGLPAVVYFAIIAAVTAVFVIIGMKYSDLSGIFKDLSYYGRYEGLDSGIIPHISAAIKCSAICLAELFVLYLMSFSPLLFPVSLTITACRGFVSGAVYCTVGSTGAAMEFILYVVITVAICLISAVFLRMRNSAYSIAKRSVLFIASAGAVTVSEFILSFLT